MGDSIFDRQSEVLMTEDVTVNSPSHEEDFDFDDVGCNADLYMLLDRTRFRARVEVEKQLRHTVPLAVRATLATLWQYLYRNECKSFLSCLLRIV